jgi:hypothetical protein
MASRYIVFIAALVASAPACVLVQDVDDFEVDQDCNLDFRIVDFFPHSTRVDPGRAPTDVANFLDDRQFTQVRVVRDSGGTLSQEMVAIFDPLPDPNTRILFPNAVLGRQAPEQSIAQLEIWADNDRNGDLIVPSGGDHTYRVGPACDFAGQEFVHNLDFDDLQPANPVFPALRVRPPGAEVPPLQRAAWFNRAIEVRIVRDIDADTVQALAFYRRERLAEFPATPDDVNIDIPNALPDDGEVRIIVVSHVGDAEGARPIADGVVDDNDLIFQATFNANMPPPPCPSRETLCRTTIMVGGESTDAIQMSFREGVPDGSGDPALREPWWDIAAE